MFENLLRTLKIDMGKITTKAKQPSNYPNDKLAKRNKLALAATNFSCITKIYELFE